MDRGRDLVRAAGREQRVALVPLIAPHRVDGALQGRADGARVTHGAGVEDGVGAIARRAPTRPHHVEAEAAHRAAEEREKLAQHRHGETGHHDLDEVGVAQHIAVERQRLGVAVEGVRRQRRLADVEAMVTGDREHAFDGRGVGRDVVVGQPDVIVRLEKRRPLAEEMGDAVPLAAVVVGVQIDRPGCLGCESAEGADRDVEVPRRPAEPRAV